MYFEGELPVVSYGNSGSYNSGWNDWSWIIGLALVGGLFGGWGNGGFGFGGGRGGYGGVADNYVLATDFATIERKLDAVSNGICDSTFALNNTITSGFFGVQNSLTQGFAGLNTAIGTGFSGVDKALCTLGYNTQAGFNALSREYADCCCKTQGAIADLKYSNERQTYDIISAINAGNQRLVDIYTNDKIESLNRKLSLAENSLARRDDREILLRAINRDRCPEPAYIVPNPNCCYQYGITGYGYGAPTSGCCA